MADGKREVRSGKLCCCSASTYGGEGGNQEGKIVSRATLRGFYFYPFDLLFQLLVWVCRCIIKSMNWITIYNSTTKCDYTV